MLFFTNVIMSVSKNKVKLHHVVPKGLSSPCSYNLPGLRNSQGHSEKIFLVQLCLHLSQKRHKINMAQPEDRATVGIDLSAELGVKTRGRELKCSLLTSALFWHESDKSQGSGDWSPARSAKPITNLPTLNREKHKIVINHPSLCLSEKALFPPFTSVLFPVLSIYKTGL